MNISSIQGLQIWPAMPTYSAGKSGLITYTRSAGHSLEFEFHGVKMVCFCPGAVETPIEVLEFVIKTILKSIFKLLL